MGRVSDAHQSLRIIRSPPVGPNARRTLAIGDGTDPAGWTPLRTCRSRLTGGASHAVGATGSAVRCGSMPTRTGCWKVRSEKVHRLLDGREAAGIPIGLGRSASALIRSHTGPVAPDPW